MATISGSGMLMNFGLPEYHSGSSTMTLYNV
jgi:hypothetical protein